MSTPHTTAELLLQLERRKQALDLAVERVRALHEPAIRRLGARIEGPRAMVRAEVERWLARPVAPSLPMPAGVRV